VQTCALPISVIAIALGLWLYVGYGIGMGPGNGWMHAKLFFVLLIIGYHHACGVMLRKFEQGRNTRSHRFYRWFNEIPVLLLVAVVLLVVLKPSGRPLPGPPARIRMPSDDHSRRKTLTVKKTARDAHAAGDRGKRTRSGARARSAAQMEL